MAKLISNHNNDLDTTAKVISRIKRVESNSLDSDDYLYVV